MFKKLFVLAIGLTLCAPAMANKHHKKYVKVVYVVERPVVRRPVVVERVVVIRPAYSHYMGYQSYRYPNYYNRVRYY